MVRVDVDGKDNDQVDDRKCELQSKFLQQKMEKPESHYSKHTMCGKAARSNGFKATSGMITCLYLMWLAIDVDHNAASTIIESAPLFMALHSLFAIWFIVELVIRIMAFDRTALAFRTVRVWGDIILLVALFAAFGYGPLVCLQLFRLFTFCSMIPEMNILVKGLFVAAKSVFFVLCLLLMLVYAFSITLSYTLGGSDSHARYFPTVQSGMFTLLTIGLLPDHAHILDQLQATSTFSVILFLVFLCLAIAVIVLGLGVLCEVVSAVANQEKDNLVQKYVEEPFANVYTQLFGSKQEITKAEYLALIDHPTISPMLLALGVDMVSLVGLSDVIFAGGGDGAKERTFDVKEFLPLAMRFAESRRAMSADVARLEGQLKATNARLARIEELLIGGITPTREGGVLTDA
eukprot:TRINITY_DN19560_c0_g1_i1.p1 TRINITY_DN19560_c0_g1~~TRINITY_DN19560_c0_g1_i1.p1  ORF type:complete len:405 (+),score=57.42 TRINITY_DN19560_c0_g1_i1:204-1418(+)